VTPLRLAAVLLLLPACAASPSSTAVSASPDSARAGPGAPCGAYGDEEPVRRTPLEARAWSEVRRKLDRAGARLQPSGALDRAARALAEAAASTDPDPLARSRVQNALRLAGAHDPSPTAHLSAGAPDDLLAALLARLDRNGWTHAGIGEHEAAGVHRLVLLLSHRTSRLDGFPGAVAAGSSATLKGELVGLLHPRAWITRPDGVSEELDLAGGRTFASPIRFALPGRYTVEIVGTGEHGPRVAALLGVSVGGAECAEPPSPGEPRAEPDDLGESELALVDAANATRRAQGLGALVSSPELAAVARRHSERMRSAGVVAHVLPGESELVDRLRAARIAYRRAFENVASGGTALDAHAATEASPAHRANLVSPSATRIGVGLARGALPTGERTIYLTEILIEPPVDLQSDRLTPDARVREALWRERERRALPALTNDPSLESLARAAALSMRAEDRGELDGLAAGALRLGRSIAASDAFIAASPGEAVRSRNLADRRFTRVGVGVVVGDSRRFGPARLFIAVVYTD